MSISRKYVEQYSHPKSPKKYTQLQKRLQLKQLPSYSTLKYFADRSYVLDLIDKMLANIIKEFAPTVEEATIDPTRMETTSISAHYKTGSGKDR
ncbi:hypothetical protein Pla110_45180 [Polystyrenella longa]|uniref:Uncharacterized protein n=1 Tax=Polystyrenella longa TaxID=2528007 RepID=A0A518CU50_9PLAN|nr:hypothetical protein [Polystyrenella longa]QDU82756.1 hypothetical protein Pla110_45180 [Polystyrenella longa]